MEVTREDMQRILNPQYTPEQLARRERLLALARAATLTNPRLVVVAPGIVKLK